MNIKRFIIVVLCLYVSITAFAQMDSMFRYKMAYKEMQNMLLVNSNCQLNGLCLLQNGHIWMAT